MYKSEIRTGGDGDARLARSGAGESWRVAMGGGEGWEPGWCSYWGRSSDLYRDECDGVAVQGVAYLG